MALFKVSLLGICLLEFALIGFTHLNCLFLESFESAKTISASHTSKPHSKVGKSASNGVLKHGNKAVSSVCSASFHVFIILMYIDFFFFLNFALLSLG